MDTISNLLDTLRREILRTSLGPRLVNAPSMTVWGAEVRLTGSQPFIALGAMVPREEAEHLSQWVTGRKEPAWQVFGKFCERWGNSEDRLHRAIPRIFVESDLARPDWPPCTFLNVEDLSWNNSPELIDVTLDGLKLLRGGDFPEAVANEVQRCLAAMPANGRLLHAGAMLCRPHVPLRLSVWCPKNELPEYLDAVQISLREDHRTVFDFCLGLVDRNVNCQLEIDGAGRLAQEAGIEITFSRPPEHEPRWHQLFDFLTAAGLSEPGRINNLLRDLPKLSLSHVKVTLSREKPLAAKAYVTT